MITFLGDLTPIPLAYGPAIIVIVQMLFVREEKGLCPRNSIVVG